MRRTEFISLLIIVTLGSSMLVSAGVEITKSPPGDFGIATDQSSQIVSYEFVSDDPPIADITFILYSASNIDACSADSTTDATMGISEIESVALAQGLGHPDDLAQDGDSYILEIDIVAKLEAKGLFTEFQDKEIWDNNDYAFNPDSDDAYICSTISMYAVDAETYVDGANSEVSIMRIYENERDIPEVLLLQASLSNNKSNFLILALIGGGLLIMVFVILPLMKKK